MTETQRRMREAILDFGGFQAYGGVDQSKGRGGTRWRGELSSLTAANRRWELL